MVTDEQNDAVLPMDIDEFLKETSVPLAANASADALVSEDSEFVSALTRARFADDVIRHMASAGLTRNRLAGMLGKSRQYIGRILNEPPNFTVGTMAEISAALGMRLSIRMQAPNEHVAVLPASVRTCDAPLSECPRQSAGSTLDMPPDSRK